MATERKQSEIHLQRSWCLASHRKSQKPLTGFIVINASHTTGPHYQNIMASSHLTLPVEYIQYGIHGTVWFGPKPCVPSNNSLSLSWPVCGALLRRDSPTFRCLGDWHIFTKHDARLWLSRNTPSHTAPWKTVPFTLKEIKSNTCIGHTLQPLPLFLTF